MPSAVLSLEERQLFLAARLGNVEMVRNLVEQQPQEHSNYNANDNAVNVNVVFPDTGRQPLHEACKYGHFDMVCYLLFLSSSSYQHNNVLRVKDKLLGWTPLFYACRFGHLKIAKLLVAHHRQQKEQLQLQHKQEDKETSLRSTHDIVHDTDKNGWTLVHVAASSVCCSSCHDNKKGNNNNGDDDKSFCLLDWLIHEQQLDINAKDSRKGWQALHYACQRNETKLVHWLLQHGADTTTQVGDDEATNVGSGGCDCGASHAGSNNNHYHDTNKNHLGDKDKNKIRGMLRTTTPTTAVTQPLDLIRNNYPQDLVEYEQMFETAQVSNLYQWYRYIVVGGICNHNNNKQQQLLPW